MRVLCHAQPLSGIGHDVRVRAIARGLAAAHEVHVVDGGRAMPRRDDGDLLRSVRLPPIGRAHGALVALGSRDDVGAVLAERAQALVRAVDAIRPDVLLIDHYPFSKWELDAEITAAIDRARAVNPRARIVCSLRDIAPQTRYERVDRAAYERRVLAALQRYFDAVLVHGDPTFTRLEAHFGPAADIPVPVRYTGFVVDPAPSPMPPAVGPTPYAVLSCGGGAWHGRFLLDAMTAFRYATDRGAIGAMPLVVFAGAFFSHADLTALERAAAGGPFRIRAFAPDFAATLGRAAFSISRAGYNTCAAILQTRVRAILVPDPVMSDQTFRARRLAELGLAITANGSDPSSLSAALGDVVARPPPQHALQLDGVARTRAALEALLR